MPILGIMASQISGHLWAPAGAYDALATVTVPSGGAASVSFVGIPSGYKHLQVRGLFLYSNTGDNMVVSYNSGSFNNVRSHYLFGDGSSATAGTDTSGGGLISINAGNTSTAFQSGIYDFLDYTNTSKTHTLRYLQGQDVNGSGVIALGSAMTTSTDAISALTFSWVGGSSFRQYSQLALYGVK